MPKESRASPWKGQKKSGPFAQPSHLTDKTAINLLDQTNPALGPLKRRQAHSDSDTDAEDEQQLTQDLIDKVDKLAQENDDSEFPALGRDGDGDMSILREGDSEYVDLQEDEELIGQIDDPETAQENLESQQGYRTLADAIFEKMEEQTRKKAEAEKRALFSEATLKLFAETGQFMSRFRSGKLPKALRIIPQLKNWIDVLWLTKPEEWTPHAIEAACPIFVNGLKEPQAQKFMRFVILPAVEGCIEKHERLNVHLYNALRRCLFKPAAFFKGIFFPTILDGNCNYKKASIICSVVSKESFPAVHAAAVLVKLSAHDPHTNQIDYAMIKLLNKKHDLPLPAVQTLTDYFSKCVDKEGPMPVIWQQCFLVFVQRWKDSISAAEKEKLKAVLKKHFHDKVTPEIRRELFSTSANTMTD